MTGLHEGLVAVVAMLRLRRGSNKESDKEDVPGEVG